MIGIPVLRARKGAIRVAVLFRNRLGADVFSSALSLGGFQVVLATSEWGKLSTTSVGVDIAVVDQHLDDGVMLGTRIRDLAERGTGTVVVGPAASSVQKDAILHAGALAFVDYSESLDDLATSVMIVATEPEINRPGEAPAPVDPRLGRREERALLLYASGRTMREVADDLGTTEETVKSYIKRARRKYRDVGIDLGTRRLLRRHAQSRGWLG